MKNSVYKLNYFKPYKNYILGFGYSLILTIVPFILVKQDQISGNSALAVLFAFAATQCGVQLIYFLHVAEDKKPLWKLNSLFSAVFIVLLVVIGSIWIINNLHYNTVPANQVEDYLLEDEGRDH